MNKTNKLDWENKRLHVYLNRKNKINKLKSIYLKRAIVVAPSVFSFFEDENTSTGKNEFLSYKIFLKFLGELSELSKKNRIWVDLSQVKIVKASAILVFYAHIEQIKNREDDEHIIKTSICSSRIASSLFGNFGIWKLTEEEGTKPHYSDISLPMLRTVPIRKGQSSEENNAVVKEIAIYVKGIIESSGLHENDEALLAGNAITESVSNVGLHAYNKDFFVPEFSRFSTSGWIIVHHLGEQLYISVYDMGAGIPLTIGEKEKYNDLINDIIRDLKLGGNMLYVVGDACRIKAAVEYGHSRFNMQKDGEKHGKGLAEAKELVDINPRGNIVIYSGTGCYSHEKDASCDGLKNLPFPFKGTLIQWNLYLGSSL